MKKKVLIAAVGITVLFFVVNIAWFTWRYSKYSGYTEKLQKNEMTSMFLVPRYTGTDEEGFSYAVKYPDYLSLTGNLSVTMPAEGDNPYTDGLIIWPTIDGTYEYGLILYEGGNSYQIETDRDGNARNQEEQGIVENHAENVRILLEKARGIWENELCRD